MFMLGALTLLRPNFVCTTRSFMMIMDQKKCFRYFFWPPAEKILKYWIRNPCYNAKILKLEISISDPKIGPNSYFWSRISSKINRKWYRSDGNLLLVPDSSLGRKLEIRIFWCLKSWVKARFLIQSWAGKHGSWGGMTKILADFKSNLSQLSFLKFLWK